MSNVVEICPNCQTENMVSLETDGSCTLCHARYDWESFTLFTSVEQKIVWSKPPYRGWQANRVLVDEVPELFNLDKVDFENLKKINCGEIVTVEGPTITFS